jgi:hypothetical protein
LRLGSYSIYWWHLRGASLGSGVCIPTEHRLKHGVAVGLEVESYYEEGA